MKLKDLKSAMPSFTVMVDLDEYATPNTILIDDMEKNIKAWVDAGGIGILHTSAADSIKQLQQYMK